MPVAEKELFHSIEKTYDLYYHLLQLSIEITRFAADRIETKRNKLRPTPEDLDPNTRFIDNAFVAQLSTNIQFNEYLQEHKLSWVNDSEIIKVLFEEIIATDFFSEYMNAPANDYAADKDVWRKIFKKVILQSEDLDDSIQDQNIYWTDDIEMVVSFIIKTIKRFDVTKGDEQPLLPMFKDEEDAEFASKLLRIVLTKGSAFREMIDAYIADGNGFLARNDNINAYASYWYALGWMDSGIFLGLISGPASGMQPDLTGSTMNSPNVGLLHEKTTRYRSLLGQALESLDTAPEVGSSLCSAAETMQGVAGSWCNQGIVLEECGTMAEALGAYSYGFAWLDAGVRFGLFRIMKNRELFTI